jgi:hypothetical protein
MYPHFVFLYIPFLTDPKGQRIAVQIDLKKWSGLWEDFQDAMVSESIPKPE